METPPNTWSEWLRRAMANRDLSISSLAELSGVSRQTIHTHLSGGRPSGPSAGRLMAAMSCPQLERAAGWASYHRTVQS